MRHSTSHFVRLLEIKDQAGGGMSGAPFPRGYGPRKTRKMRLGKIKKTLTTTEREWLESGQWEEGGWMAGEWAALVAECTPYIDLQRGSPACTNPPQDRETVWVLLADFFSVGGVLSSCTAGTRMKADKHWQNLKNCCHSPTDVHYVSRALRFPA